jgi:hypothetical protein
MKSLMMIIIPHHEIIDHHSSHDHHHHRHHHRDDDDGDDDVIISLSRSSWLRGGCVRTTLTLPDKFLSNKTRQIRAEKLALALQIVKTPRCADA